LNAALGSGSGPGTKANRSLRQRVRIGRIDLEHAINPDADVPAFGPDSEMMPLTSLMWQWNGRERYAATIGWDKPMKPQIVGRIRSKVNVVELSGLCRRTEAHHFVRRYQTSKIHVELKVHPFISVDAESAQEARLNGLESSG
jgi:hypothetical protein